MDNQLIFSCPSNTICLIDDINKNVHNYHCDQCNNCVLTNAVVSYYGYQPEKENHQMNDFLQFLGCLLLFVILFAVIVVTHVTVWVNQIDFNKRIKELENKKK